MAPPHPFSIDVRRRYDGVGPERQAEVMRRGVSADGRDTHARYGERLDGLSRAEARNKARDGLDAALAAPQPGEGVAA